MPPQGKKLTPKQEAFCQEYVKNDGNGAQACISAGYSPKGARVRASKLLTKDNIKVRLEELRSENTALMAIPVGMSEMETKFCIEYIKDFNKVAAAIRAGYSARSVHNQVWRLMNREEIQQFIKDLKNLVFSDLMMEAREIIAHHVKIARSHPSNVFDDKWKIKPKEEIDPDTLYGISQVKSSTVHGVAQNGTEWEQINTDVRFHDKQKSLEHLAKFLGMYEKDNSQKSINIQNNVIIQHNIKTSGKRKADRSSLNGNGKH